MASSSDSRNEFHITKLKPKRIIIVSNSTKENTNWRNLLIQVK